MRKFIVGFMVGAVLMFAGQVFADSASKIGKVIQGEITVVFDGTELSTTGIVVDGTSYLPIRAIGTVMGLNIDYLDGKVILNTSAKEAPSVEGVQEAVQAELERREKEKQKQEIEAKIADIEGQLTKLYDDLNKEKVEAVRQVIQMNIDLAETKLAELRAELAELEAE